MTDKQDDNLKDEGEKTAEDVILDADGASLDDSVVAEEGAGETIKKLRLKLKESEKKSAEYLSGWQRAKADLINFKRRNDEEKIRFVKFANEELIEKLLPTMDSFHTAFGNKEVWEKVDLNWRMGVQHIYSQLLSVLEQHGVSVLNPLGEVFNPAKHQSVGMAPVSEEEKNGKVVETVQKGYAINDKIIQPAKVKVGEYKK